MTTNAQTVATIEPFSSNAPTGIESENNEYIVIADEVKLYFVVVLFLFLVFKQFIKFKATKH